jgi:hypothetical protein
MKPGVLPVEQHLHIFFLYLLRADFAMLSRT